jgi:hypothetical protein
MIADYEGSGTVTKLVMECGDGQHDDIGHHHAAEPQSPRSA